MTVKGHSIENRSKMPPLKNFFSPILLIFAMEVPLEEILRHVKFFFTRTHILGFTGVQKLAFIGVFGGTYNFRMAITWAVLVLLYRNWYQPTDIEAYFHIQVLFFQKKFSKKIFAQKGAILGTLDPQYLKIMKKNFQNIHLFMLVQYQERKVCVFWS